MINYVKAIEHARTHGIMAASDHGREAFMELCYTSKRKSDAKRDKHFYELMMSAKIFVFEDTNSYRLNLDDAFPLGFEPMLSLPFQTCWFECRQGQLAISEDTKSQTLIQKTLGILVHEKTPGDYDLYLFLTGALVLCGDNHHDIIYIPTNDREDADLTFFATETIKLLLTQLQAPATSIGSVNVDAKVKLKIDGEKRFHKIRKIIYVTHKDRIAVPITGGFREVDWSHRWLTRGHWRAVKGVGKNREGQYTVSGHTWVTEHEKGPEHMPLIADKTRVVR